MFRERLHDEKNLTFLEHLEELRHRLIVSFAAIAIGVCIGLLLAKPVNHILIQPFKDSGLLAKKVDIPNSSAKMTISNDGVVRMELPQQQLADANTTETLATTTLALTQILIYEEGNDTPVAIMGSTPESKSSLVYLRPLDPFSIYFKTALIVGIILALPVIVYQFYQFIAPGLLDREREAIKPLFFAAGILFPVGACFAYYLMRYAIFFLAQYALQEVAIFNDIKAYLSFALMMILAFGILFEFPVIVVLLTRLGIVTPEFLASKRKVIFVLILIVAAFATPGGDPFSLFVLSLPLYLLFEGALIFSRIGLKKQALLEAEAEAEEEEKSE